ncbi:unnamed protein product [Adineta steineri]|uniref:PSI domain-containing protein n=2 Tax=Adineta steineri TaxID=433720 RepID=A0A819FFS8_9BILA|nr:unnamed protein product [Adineta steineri]
MKYFVQIFIYLIFLLNKSNGNNEDIILMNDLSYQYQEPYKIISTNARLKRDQSSWFYPEIDKDQISCGQNVYVKLFQCLDVKDCKAFSSCFDSLHCPLSVKSYGSLILNLLRLLGIDKCNIDDQHQLCPHEKRSIITKKLFTYWSHNKDDNYCHTISDFMNEVKKEVQYQCPINVKQVQIFLENYSCPPSKDTIISSVTMKSKDEIHMPSVEGILSTPSTILSSHFAYIDETNDFKFLDSNKSLFNTSEQTVYINDHHYYNVSYIVRNTEGIPMNFVHDNDQFIRIHALSNRHRSAFGIGLKFGFPFYGHVIYKILVATGGFIYTGDLLHSALIGSTQYIAPFMANFDASLGDNETEISYYDNGTHFVCTWTKVYLQDQQDAGPFTFQAILQNTGNIYFNYLQIPKVKISSSNHAHRIGLSDAYLSQHSTNEHIVRVITLYDKINLDKEKIHNGVSIIFDMDQTCNTFTDCASCLANRGKRYNCSWCNDIQKCSDGYDRSRQQWIRSQCHRLASDNTCSNSMEDIDDDTHFPSSSPPIIHFENRKESLTAPSRHYSTFRTIVVTLLLSVLILSLVTLAVTYGYAYRNPTSSAGMWLLEHRPSNYIARFKRFTGSN